MTDQTIPADKVRVVRDLHLEEAKLVSITDAEREIHQRVADAMEALLPATQTLAEEIRGYAERFHPVTRRPALRALADRVESLETWLGIRDKELEGARKDCEYLAEERDKARVSVEEQAAEITRLTEQRDNACEAHDAAEDEIIRLSAREIPEGWRVADHKEHGRVFAYGTWDENGDVPYVCANLEMQGDWCNLSQLTFRDEAPAPEPEPEPEHIDPKTCGRYRPYLVQFRGHERVGRRDYHNGPNHPWSVTGDDGEYSFGQDEATDIKVIRPLTSEEMDAR